MIDFKEQLALRENSADGLFANKPVKKHFKAAHHELN